MRRRRTSLFVAGALALAPATAAQGGAGATSSGAAFLLVPVGARATALGQAAIADHGTGESAFWNPAGLASLSRSEFAAHFAQTFISNNGALSAYIASDQVGVLGVAAYVLDLGSQDVIPPGSMTATGRTSLRNIELIASYATRVGSDLALGVNYKLIQFRQDCSGDCRPTRTIVGTTHAVDLGLQWAVAADQVRLGVALRHAGFRLQLENRDQADPLPTTLVMGISWGTTVTRLDDGTTVDARLLVDLQDDWGAYASPEALVGVEMGYGTLVRLRAGYALVTGDTRGPSIGFGVELEGVHIDFARVFYAAGTFDEPAYLSVRVAL